MCRMALWSHAVILHRSPMMMMMLITDEYLVLLK
jgi:hypothetical protein